MILLTLILSNSCKDEKKSALTNDYELILKDSLNIFLPDTIPHINHSRNWCFNNNTLSFITSEDEVMLYNYNFLRKKWSNINLSRLRNGRIQYSGQFNYLNDSLLIYCQKYKNQILIINMDSEKILKEYSFPSGFKMGPSDFLNYYENSKCYYFQAIYNDWYNYSEFKPYVGLQVDKATGECSFIAPFPYKSKLNHQSSLKTMFPDMVLLKNELILSFKTENNLLIYNINDSTYRTIQCQDFYIDSHQKFKTTGDKIKDAILEELYGMYKEFFYDPLKRNYYRISVAYPAFKGNSLLPNEEISTILKSRTLTVSVLDSNLILISQTPINNVSEINFFIKDDLLWLRKSISNENEINFYGFQLVKKQIRKT